MKPIFTSAAASFCFAALSLAQPQPRYAVTDLGTLPGGNFSQATFINDNRLVTGLSNGTGGAQQAVFWGGPFRIDIGTPGLNSGAFGMNAAGTASVQAEVSTKDPNNENFCAYGTGLECQAFAWQRGVLTPLPLLGGNNGTVGNVNSRGEIPGVAENATRDPQCAPGVSVAGTGPQVLDFEAVVWGPGPGQVRQLHPLPGDTVGIAIWINDNDQAVGATGTCANTVLPPLAFGAHAVIWDKDGTPHDLGNLGGANINMALAINNPGQVVGASSTSANATPGNGTHGFLWTSKDGMRDLGTLPGDVASVGLGISDAGDIIGTSFDPNGHPRAILWRNGALYDLNTVVVSSPLYLLWGAAINASGEIAGFGVDGHGDVHAYLGTPARGAAQEAAPAAALPESLRVVLGDKGRYTVVIPRPR
jgi:probable HAF family extracellular repeat protein